jgi:hypothetical protein
MPSLPPPDPKATDSDTGHRRRGLKSQTADIPSIEELLDMLLKLNGLVMLNVISTAQANTIQRRLRAILDTQLKRAQWQLKQLPQEALAELCRSNPQILNLLVPLFLQASTTKRARHWPSAT